MLKKLTLTFALVLAGAMLFTTWHAPQVQAGAICDPKFGVLCVGLGDYFDFEEATDSVRLGTYADTPLFEMDAMDITRSSGSYKKLGTYGAQFSGSNYFHSPRGGPTFGSGMWTTAFWIYPTANSADKGIMSNTSANRSIAIDLEYRSSQLYPRFRAYEEETLTEKIAQGDTYVAQNAWSLVVVTFSMFGDYGQSRVCISVNAQATPACTSIPYTLRAASGGQFDVGSAYYYTGTTYFTGYMDGLIFASRPWSTTDISTYYNSGSGLAFPFY